MTPWQRRKPQRNSETLSRTRKPTLKGTRMAEARGLFRPVNLCRTVPPAEKWYSMVLVGQCAVAGSRDYAPPTAVRPSKSN